MKANKDQRLKGQWELFLANDLKEKFFTNELYEYLKGRLTLEDVENKKSFYRKVFGDTSSVIGNLYQIIEFRSPDDMTQYFETILARYLPYIDKAMIEREKGGADLTKADLRGAYRKGLLSEVLNKRREKNESN